MDCEKQIHYTPAYIWIGLCSWIISPILLYYNLTAVFYSTSALIVTVTSIGMLLLGYWMFLKARKCFSSLSDTIQYGMGSPIEQDFQQRSEEILIPNSDITEIIVKK